MARPARGTPVRVLLRALFVASLGQPSSGAAAAPPRVDRELGPLVHMQVMRAATRLASPECALVLHDFFDGRTARPIAETLAASGQTAADHLGSLSYRIGPAGGPCGDPRINAYTFPGSHVIFICRDQMLRWQKSREGIAANVLIHETLHSLGLGENPPSPAEIDARIEARCGR